MDKEIQQFLIEKGADLIRFADISSLPKEVTQGYKKAVVFCIALTGQFIFDIRSDLLLDENKDLPDAKDEFSIKEKRADEIAGQLAEFIKIKGYRAYAQSENNNEKNGLYDKVTATSILPHKTIARFAGLGFIGKSDLLITKEYGSAFSMCTILTDAPVKAEYRPVKGLKCGSCDLCVKACPANAIHGREWTENDGRESLVDISKCCCNYKCMTACPWTLRYAAKDKSLYKRGKTKDRNN